MIIMYVDDMLIIGRNLEAIAHLKMESLGPDRYFLRVCITRNREEGVKFVGKVRHGKV